MRMFTSVAALLACITPIQEEIMESMLTHPSDRRKLEKFLGVKIARHKPERLRVHKTEDTGTRHKKRIKDAEDNVVPTWEVFTRKGDRRRTYEEHQEIINNMRNNPVPLGCLDDSDPISSENVDPRALTVVLNLIHAVNPTITEFTPIESGNPWSNATRPGHSRKIGNSYKRIHTRSH